MPQNDWRFYLYTDASDKGVGAVLSQEQDGREVVLVYASRTLSKPERNYDVTRRELLAVVFGLKTYRQYLLGREFVIRTDHSALQSLRRTPEPIGQQARWQAFIEQFSFVIVHRPGTRHQNADALSRRPIVDDSVSSDESSEDEVCGAVTVGSRPPDRTPSGREEASVSAGESISELQQSDTDIGPILRRRLQQTEQPRPEEVVIESTAAKALWSPWHSFVLRDGVLYRRTEGKRERPPFLQLIVPAVK